MARWVTFDCYGTLVDWNAGLRGALGSDELLGATTSSSRRFRPRIRRARTGRCCARRARRLGVDADPAESLPRWPVFPEVSAALEEARERDWRLAILSNTDRDLLDASMDAIGVPFDLSIVASEIGSYKPAERHWRAFEETVGRLPDAHVAQSLFHDIATANALGIPNVWINRLGEDAGDTRPNVERQDLHGLADVLDRL